MKHSKHYLFTILLLFLIFSVFGQAKQVSPSNQALDEFNGASFNCYDISFSRYIDACIPESFPNKHYFDNKLLIKKIADTLKE